MLPIPLIRPCKDFIILSLERMEYVKGGKFVQAARLVGKSPVGGIGTPAGVSGERGLEKKESVKAVEEREFNVDAPPRAEGIMRSSSITEPENHAKKNRGHKSNALPLDLARANTENLERSILGDFLFPSDLTFRPSAIILKSPRALPFTCCALLSCLYALTTYVPSCL